MGEAKKRGARAERKAQAQAAQLAEPPINLVCRTCGKVLTDFVLVQHSPAGACWQSACPCGALTTAVVQARFSSWARALASTLSIKEKVTDEKGRVSVSFHPRTPETVDTGMVAFNGGRVPMPLRQHD